MKYLDLEADKVENVVTELNVLLADYHIYYQKLRGFHWNILGKFFFDLHEKFEELYNDARVKIDDIAERILTLGTHPVSLLKDYLAIATIKEENPLIEDKSMIESLLNDHNTILKQMRKVIEVADEAGDEGTIDLIGAYIRELEKYSWMLNAWYKGTGDSLKRSKMN